MKFLVTRCIASMTLILTLVDATVIHSERVTDWGNWGSMDQCPPGSFVKAINVKVEADQGRGDDSAMNAVHLNCVPINDQVTSSSMRVTKVLKSAEGPWGHFRGLEYCHRGVAVGFQLRSEDWQRKGDDTAANDMTLICANSNGRYTTQSRGLTWGSWRTQRLCPPQTAVCGLQTQVEPHQGRGDDTALNNVNLLCCNLPNPAVTCQPKDSLQLILQRDNTHGTTTLHFTRQEKVGVQKTVQLSQSSTVTEELAVSVGFGVSASLPGLLAANFETKLSWSSATQHSWSKSETSVFTLETVETMSVDIPPKCSTSLYQIVGRCGPYTVNSNVIRRVDKCIGGRRNSAVEETTHILLGNPSGHGKYQTGYR